MPTLIEEQADYPEKVRSYLNKNGRRRLPWGSLVHGHIVVTATHKERQRHEELAEAALSLVLGLGVTEVQLDAMADALPWNATPAEHVAKLQELRSSTGAQTQAG